MRLGGREVASYGSPYIIAEIGANHNGDMNLARKLVLEAKRAGCDCVKFQSWTKETIFSRKVYEDNYFLNDDYRTRSDYTLEKIVDAFSMSPLQLREMAQLCVQTGIDFASSVFSNKEVDFVIDELDVKFVKIASMDLNNLPFLSYVAAKGKPIVLSTGMGSLPEIDDAVRTIEATGNQNIVVLHCVSVYPPTDATVNLLNIDMLRDAYPQYPIGFSDHSLGSDIPLAAVARGAALIEKHFTLDKGMFGWDHKVSADAEEMSSIVSGARRINLALGERRRAVSEAEIEQRAAYRRSIVAAREIPAGKIIEKTDLDYKRPGTGIQPKYADLLVGRVARRKVEYDRMLEWSDV